ncbi:MAG TPA: hypothetical protein GX512_03755 [Firmicutes bacterium]|nr:hypothetical protein [Candidatus Fermentithermobacillaceae bacterium]
MFEEQIFPTLSPDEPEEAEDTEKDAPEEADEAADTAGEEEATADEKAEGDKPQLIFGKYKSLEEAEKAYKNLERSFGKKSTEAARLRKELEQLRTPAKDEKTEPDPLEEVLKDPDKWMERLYKEGPKAVLEIVEKAVERRTKPIEEKVATNTYMEQVRQFREEHPDLDEYAEDMAEWLKAHPKIAREPDALETAYKAVKFDRLMETLPSIVSEASKTKAKANLDKQAARMPSGGRQTAKEPTPEDALAASLLAEDRKARGIFG